MKQSKYLSPKIHLVQLVTEYCISSTSTASFMSGGNNNNPEVETWIEEVKNDQITF
ncbi:hypothetical protein [Sphingobacterium bovistauri]|uniref:Uncharacterized protein n=1 Tax=Sphingobacterium bovistauri TaxID=2781959 RepID=A0ABS7Z322_9SPHI|nr:hypothetical protein [Sphingobacterium bovistauri]MCA5004566.1 hypothetical protein [Sphingobacterium bovistauri]